MAVRFEGLKRYQRRIREAPKKIDREESAALRDVSGKLHQDVRARAPVDTGELRAKTVLTPVRRRGQVKAVIVAGRAPHAGIVNYGSRHMRPTWYFTRAVEAIREVARTRFGRVFKVV